MFDNLSKEDLVRLLSTNDKALIQSIYDYADKVRKEYMGDDILLRGIIEFSNFCRNNCTYCGIRYSNDKINRYRIEPDRIVEIAKRAYAQGYKTIVLQSGEDVSYTQDKICYIIKQLKQATNLKLTLSVGERPFAEYASFRKAGADRFLIKHETSNKAMYEKMHPRMSFEHRLECLRELKRLGFEAGSGIMIGLPNQTIESIADDILLFKELDVDMIGMGPYLPHQDTPLGQEFSGYQFDIEEMTYKILALTRIVTKRTNLPATTALATINPEKGRVNALNRGANVVMLNVTDQEFKANYSIYPEKVCLAKQEPLTPAELTESLNIPGRNVV